MNNEYNSLTSLYKKPKTGEHTIKFGFILLFILMA